MSNFAYAAVFSTDGKRIWPSAVRLNGVELKKDSGHILVETWTADQEPKLEVSRQVYSNDRVDSLMKQSLQESMVGPDLLAIVDQDNKMKYGIWLPVKLQDKVEITKYLDDGNRSTTLLNIMENDSLDWIFRDLTQTTGKQWTRQKREFQYPLGPFPLK